MARMMTAEDAVAEIRTRADMSESTFLSDAQILGFLNQGIAELYDLLIKAFGDEYFGFQGIAGWNYSASQPDVLGFIDETAEHRYKVTGVWWIENPEQVGSRMWPILKATPAEAHRWPSVGTETGPWFAGTPVRYRDKGGDSSQFFHPGIALGLKGVGMQFTPEPNHPATVLIEYIPSIPKLELGNTPADEFNGFNGWEDYALWRAVAYCLSIEESDPSFALAMLGAMTDRVMKMAEPDQWEAPRMMRKRGLLGVDSNFAWSTTASQLSPRYGAPGYVTVG